MNNTYTSLQGWGSLTMTSTGKFVYIYIYIYIYIFARTMKSKQVKGRSS